jgi:hypothetical protein
MDATANFSLRFAQTSAAKVDRTDWLLSRQLLERIATRMSLVGEAIGFLVLGILIIVNRRQADLNGLACGSAVAIIAGLSALLVSFLHHTSSRAAGQVLVHPFHFRQTQPSHSNRSVACIGISARGGKNERRKSRK